MADLGFWRSALLAGAAAVSVAAAAPAQAQEADGARSLAGVQLAQAEERGRGRWGGRQERTDAGASRRSDGDRQARQQARQEQRERRSEARAQSPQVQPRQARSQENRAPEGWRARRADDGVRAARSTDGRGLAEQRQARRERVQASSALGRAAERSRRIQDNERAANARAWQDRGDWRNGARVQGREVRDQRRQDWRDDRRYSGDGNRNRWRDGDRRWDNSWRRDRRYDWNNYRSDNRSAYRLGRYYAPYRNYSYRPLNIGFYLEPLFFGERYWISDPWQYRLPAAYGPYRWVRYYDDVMLIDVYSGEVVDVVYDFFW